MAINSAQGKKERLPLLDMLTFSFGAFGKDAAGAVVGVYYMFFLTQVVSLNAAVVGGVFSAFRLIFAFVSPLAGTMIDNTKSKLGKYRPWIISGVSVCAVALFMMFVNVTAADAAKYVFYLSFYVIWELAGLILDISFWAFLPTITDNPGDRNNVVSFSKITSGIGMLVITAGAPFFFTYFFGSEFDPKGYFALAAITSALMLAGGFSVYFLNKERVKIPSATVKLKDLFKTLFDNDQLIAYFFSFLLINTGAALTTNFAIYFFAFDIGNMQYFSIFAVLAGLGQGIGLMTYPILAKRVPIKTILLISAISQLVGYAMMFLVVLIFNSNIVLLCISAVIALFAGGWIATASQSMLVDITDYGEYKLKNRTSGLVFSANTMQWRINSAIVVFALGISLSAAGINGVDVNGGELPEISIKGLWLIRFMMAGLPMLLIGGGLAVFLSKYTLNAREMARIQKELEIRRALVEEKKRRKEELKALSEQLREAKKAYRKDKWKKRLKSDKEHSFKREKKISVKRATKRMTDRKKNKEKSEKEK